LSEFEECCGERTDNEPDAAYAVLFVGFFAADRGGQDGCDRDPFGEWKICFDDECSSEGDHPEDAKHSSDEGDEGRLKIMYLCPGSDEDEGGDGEDDSGCDAFACGCPHGRDVDFEDCWFEWFHERQCHDRAWDDG
jgi:hypothetical protein